jgi:hypothetical protein
MDAEKNLDLPEVLDPTSPYFGMRNLLDLVLPAVVDRYLAGPAPAACDCPACRRDILACALASLQPLYYGSLAPRRMREIRLQRRTVGIEGLDAHVRRAVALVSEVPHHDRGGYEVELISPEEVRDTLLEHAASRPLMERLYGTPVPMCPACGELGARSRSRYCDACGTTLVMGLPQTSLRGS